MASLNLPSHIPNQIVDKRNPLEMALIAFLSGAAQNAGGKLVDNALAADMAPKVGQEKASFGSKLINGPTVSREQFAQMTQEEAMMKRLQSQLDASKTEGVADRTLKKELTAAEITARQAELDKRLTQDKAFFDRTSGQTDKRISNEGLALSQADTRIAQDQDRNDLQKMLAQLQVDEFKSKQPLTAAQIKALEASTGKTLIEAEGQQSQNDFIDKVRNPKAAANPLEGANLPKSKSGATSAAPSATASPKLTADDVASGRWTDMIEPAQKQETVKQLAANMAVSDEAKAAATREAAVLKLQELYKTDPRLAEWLSQSSGIPLGSNKNPINYTNVR